jgi:hypothetical protein
MIRIQAGDVTYEGKDAKAIVRQMKKDDWGMPPGAPKRDFEAAVGERVYQATGRNIQTQPADAFLRELADVGLITIEADDA